eukprot:TRINITY_DN2666_c1_g1_i10.p1 TRINITY_DN2666_c1_g1~~TRINITY_DN2666_c1_g1_i10.p1  ORF type:complete len:345 (+),score=44.15 TRINITY_DN2666_c1_g1_i10:34-1035(+)
MMRKTRGLHHLTSRKWKTLIIIMLLFLLYPLMFVGRLSNGCDVRKLVLRRWEENLLTVIQPYNESEVNDVQPVYPLLKTKNTARKKKRKTAAWSSSPKLTTPFNATLWNFNKAEQVETLSLWDGLSTCSGPHSILSNKFPIGRYSGVLLPFVRSNLPQVLMGNMTVQYVELALNFLMVFSEEDSMKIGFNSLAAGASVNHLHFQFWSISTKLPVEVAKCDQIWNSKGVTLLRSHHLIPSVIFRFPPSLISEAAKLATPALSWLTSNNIPFNLLMSRDFDATESQSISLCLMPRKPTSAASMIASVLPPGFPKQSFKLQIYKRIRLSKTTPRAR